MRVALFVAMLSLGLAVVSGCKQKEEEKATEGMQNAAADMQEATDKAADAATDEMKKAGEFVGQAAEERK
jgi:outer membrane lipoprotein-sorting protein